MQEEPGPGLTFYKEGHAPSSLALAIAYLFIYLVFKDRVSLALEPVLELALVDQAGLELI